MHEQKNLKCSGTGNDQMKIAFSYMSKTSFDNMMDAKREDYSSEMDKARSQF